MALKLNPNLQGKRARDELPMIIITRKEDLATYFPTVWHEARLASSSAHEWHMPCPRCQGHDRFIVSNGKFWCRVCGYGGIIASLNGDAVPLTPEEAAELRAKAKAEADAEERERKAAVQELTQSRIWMTYHETLLQNPQRLQQLEQDGVGLPAVRHFKIGLCPQFKYWVDGPDGRSVPRYSPTFTFPHFRWMVIGNTSGTWCSNIRHRLLDPEVTGDKYRPHRSGLGLDYFPALFKGTQWGVIVEGEKKALNFWSRGIPAIGIWGVHAFYDWWVREIQTLWPAGRFVVLDHENPALDLKKYERITQVGQRLAQKVNGTWVELPLIGKPDDLLNSGRLTVAQLLQVLVNAEARASGVEVL